MILKPRRGGIVSKKPRSRAEHTEVGADTEADTEKMGMVKMDMETDKKTVDVDRLESQVFHRILLVVV